MTAPAPAGPLTAPLRREHAATRRALIARHAVRAAAAIAVAIAALVALGLVLPATPALGWARLALALLVAAAALVFATRALRAEWPAWDAWLEQLEGRFPELRSLLRNAIDLEQRDSPHTSAELTDALRADAARRLAAVPIASERPALAARGALLRGGGALVALLALALLLPQATLRSWRTLWDPASAAPPIALVVEPGSVTLAPGATLSVRARVTGSANAPRLLGEGASPAPSLESTSDGARHWRFDLPPVTRERAYAVRIERVESPRYRISLAGEPQPVSFAVEYRAPAYARLPLQSGAAIRGDLAALRGSRAHVEVTFDRDVERAQATLGAGAPAAFSAITPRRWRGDLPIDRDGTWTLRAEAAEGAGEYHYAIQALPDAPPVITVSLPEGDQDVPSGQQVPYDVLVQDDLGLGSLKLEFRKDAAQPWRDVPLASFRDEPREAHVSARWDAAALALLPGETGAFRFEVTDNDRVSGPAHTTSAEFHLRFPSLADLYQNLDQRQEQVTQSLQKVADQAKEVQKSLDQLQRQQQPRGATATPQFERAEEMRKATEKQAQLAKQIDQAAQQMQEHMADAAEREAFHDELQQKLREMSQLLQQIQSPEFKDALERMQKALQQMDKRAMEQALPQMQEQNKDLLKNLERSLALLKQLREEEKLDALAQRAEELKKQQDALNEPHAEPKGAPPSSPSSPTDAQKAKADQQRKAAEKTEQLAKDAEDAAKQSENSEAKQDLQSASKELREQAAPKQQQAAQETESGQEEQSSQSGKQASESLEMAAQKMGHSSAQQQQQRQSEDLAAVRRSAQDLVALSREASQNVQQSGSQQDQADRQTDLSEGVARVADSLQALSQETPFLSPKVSQSLGKAMDGLSHSGREMAQGNRARGQMEGQSAASALNAAVNALRESAASMCNKPGMGQEGQSSAMRMGQMGKQQSSLNHRSQELAQRLSQQMRLSAGDHAEVRRLADEQARIRQQLEEVQRDEAQHPSLLGRLEQTRKEMQQVEEQLRAGNPGDDLEEKQTKILSRLLDAQRSVNRRDFDPQREAVHADDVAHASAPALPADLLRENDRLRLDLLKADADRYPAQYRAFIERYLRSLNGAGK